MNDFNVVPQLCQQCALWVAAKERWSMCPQRKELFKNLMDVPHCGYFVHCNRKQLDFKTLNQVEQFIKFWMPRIDFVTTYSRKQLAEILRLLYPWKKPVSELAQPPFSDMCKRRMVKHIENYMNLHFKREWR